MSSREQSEEWEWYEECWRLMLSHLLHYTREKTEYTVKDLKRIPSELLSAKRPQHHLAYNIIPDSFKASHPTLETEILAGEVDRAIATLGRRLGKPLTDFSSTDWDEARQDVKRILSEHGLKLPDS